MSDLSLNIKPANNYTNLLAFPKWTTTYDVRDPRQPGFAVATNKDSDDNSSRCKEPIIVHLVPAMVIHVEPREFMSLVQRLTRKNKWGQWLELSIWSLVIACCKGSIITYCIPSISKLNHIDDNTFSFHERANGAKSQYSNLCLVLVLLEFGWK